MRGLNGAGKANICRPRSAFRALQALACATVAGLAYGFATFDRYSAPSGDTVSRSAAAIVFTGQFDRVDAALRLVDRGLVNRVHVSGLNARAGLSPATFAAQFAARNPDLSDVDRLVQCCVSWSVQPDTTLQNADEARCWVEQSQIEGSLLLVTSRLHMARAHLALSRALGDRTIVPYPVADSGGELTTRARAREFIKLIALTVAVRAPGSRLSAYLHGPFAPGCAPMS